MTDRVVEVLGLPEGVDDELLSLYFENKRRSGGGPLVSVEKTEDRALLVFEEPEAAARVLSKEHHVVHNVELSVRKPASKDPCRFLLKGLNPSTSIEMIELYVENLLNVNVPEYTLYPSLDNKLILIQLSQPLAQDFQRLNDRISKRALSGAVVTLEEVTETDTVLVENVHPGTTTDLISLYFESRRGGGQRVKEVVMLSEASAKVTFVCFESVGLILNSPHKLEGAELLIKPYFDFLQPKEAPSLPLTDSQPSPHNVPDQPDLYVAPEQPDTEQEEAPMQITPSSPDSLSLPILIPRSINTVEVMEEAQPEEVRITTETLTITDLAKLLLFEKSTLPQDTLKFLPGYNITVKNNGVHITGPAGTEIDQIKSTIMQFFSNLAEVTFTLEQAQAQFLAQKDVRERMEQMIDPLVTLYTISDCTVVVASLSEDSAKQACEILRCHLSTFNMQVDPENESMLYCREWQEFCRALGLVQVSERGRSLEVVTLKGMESEKQAAILSFLTTPIEREMFIAMEPGRLKYIQTHSHQLLADMTEVSIFPVEDSDVCGLKIHGHPTACQIAEELLQGLVSDICTRTITINAPGITRFLETDECKKMFHNMETRFRVCIFRELVPWEPPVNQNIFECAWKLMGDKNFSTQPTPGPHHIEANTTLLNEAKKIVSVIEENTPEPVIVDALEDMENVDLYSAEEPMVSSGLKTEDSLASETTASENPMIQGASGISSNLEEEAQLSLAIQYSMESNSWPMEDEDAQLQKALELSRKLIQEEVVSHQGTLNMEDPAKRALEDTIQSANTLKLVVFASYTSDLIRVDIAFGKKVSLRQDEQKLEHRCLKYVSSFFKTCLDVIRRNHGVKIDIVGTIISVSGFKTHVDEAIPNVKILLEKMSDSVSDNEILRTVQWFQHGPAVQKKTPYPPDLTILLDNARRMRLRTLDILLDNQPHTVNIEKMEVHNNTSGAVLKISREPFRQGDDNTEVDSPEEDYSILSNLPEATKVDEDSDEFQTVVKNFYETIQHYHSRIRIIKVEKLMNNLLHSQYKLKKASVMQSAVYPQVERTLYHGTSESSVKEICVHGFNRSFCGKNATVYGQGVYFAVNSALSLSDQYSPPNVDGHKYVFVAKVLTGDYTIGNHSMKTAPLRETGDIPLRYNSVTDDITKPNLFVIFNDTQAFPEYLITCQHIYGH